MTQPTFLFINGSIIPARRGLIDSLAPWKVRGEGVFETMRCSEGKVFLFREHLVRLNAGLKTLNIVNPCAHAKIKKSLYEVLAKNNLDEARIRLMVWKNDGAMNICIVTQPYQPPSKKKYRQGVRTATSRLKLSNKDRMHRIKSIAYLPYLKAYQKALRKRKDEALLVNPKNQVIEGSRTNIFLIKKGILQTPGLKSGCLKGIVRQQVIKIAKELKIKTQETMIFPKDLLSAEEVFLTNSLLGIIRVQSIDGKKMPRSSKASLTQRIGRVYEQHMRKTSK